LQPEYRVSVGLDIELPALSDEANRSLVGRLLRSEAYGVLKALKAYLDPNQIMNPEEHWILI